MIVTKKQFFSIKILYNIRDKGYNFVMRENKVKYLKEAELQKKAKKNFDSLNKYQTDPIRAKFKAFQKTKKEIDIKDLF